MDYLEWENYYLRILEDFGFDRKGDEESARILDETLGGSRVSDEELETLLRGQDVIVVGNASSARREVEGKKGILVAADEATSILLKIGRRPDMIVTDLDGDVSDQIRSNLEGSIAVVHGHGNNIPAVKRWAWEFRGHTVATTQSRPSGRLRNFGGFTDGDRAVFLADHFGARKISLVGFDFENPSEKDRDKETKQRKLDWAYILIQSLGRDELNL